MKALGILQVFDIFYLVKSTSSDRQMRKGILTVFEQM